MEKLGEERELRGREITFLCFYLLPFCYNYFILESVAFGCAWFSPYFSGWENYSMDKKHNILEQV